MISLKLDKENVKVIKEKAETVDRLVNLESALDHVKSILCLCFYDHKTEKYLSQSEALEILSTFHRETIMRMFEGLTKASILIGIGLTNEVPIMPVRNITIKFNVDQITDKIIQLDRDEIDDSYFEFCIQRYIVARSLYDDVAQEYLPDDEVENAIQEIIENDMFEQYLAKLETQIQDETTLKPYRNFLDKLDF